MPPSPAASLARPCVLWEGMIYAFGEYVLDTLRVALRQGERIIPLEPKSYDLLCLLIENRDRVVSRDEIFDQVWPGVFVTEASLSTAVSQIRRALGDDGKEQGVVRTVRGRGFQFVPEARGLAAQPAEAAADGGAGDASPRRGPPVIAVLPFGLIGTDDTHRAIAEAVPTELIATLARLKSLKVIARGSAFRFNGANADLDEIRAKLGATYALSGSVELSGRRLSIMAELVDLRDHQIVWCESFTGGLDDVFDLRGQIAREVADVLEFRLAMHESELLRHVPSENLDAWGHYHRGVRAMYHYNDADNRAAGAHFARAAALDPGFARAHAGLSYTEFQNYFQRFGTAFDHHKDLALDHAETAVRLDPVDPYCNLMLGRAKWVFGEVEDGLTWVDRSLNLSPNYSFAFYNSALLNTVLCDGERAEAHVAAALARSPLDPHLQTMMGTRALAAFVRGDEKAALQHAEEAIRRPNAHLHVYLIAAGLQALYGREAMAERAVAEIRRRNVPAAKTGFLQHFGLRDEARRQELLSALERLGV